MSESVNLDNTINMRYYIPSIITVLALCAGISAIRLAFEMEYEKAIKLVIIAAALDGFDGRIARLLNAASPFGAQLDSLADCVNFGVAPALIVYMYILHNLHSIGWIAVLIYSVACCLRLARFNATLNDSKIAKWQKNYFVGIPAPAGALLVLMPVYLGALGVEFTYTVALLFCFYTVCISFLLISRFPVWNAKNFTLILRRDLMVMILLVLVAYVSFLVTYPWETLTLTSIFYLLFLPVSCFYYRKQYLANKNS